MMKNKILLTAAILYTASLYPETWAAVGGGNWGTPANWAPATVPNGVGATAIFGGSIGAPSTVTLDISPTVGTLEFSNLVNSYSIAPMGANFLTFNVSVGAAALNNTGGAHTISAPVTLASNLVITNTSVSITLSGVISGTGSVNVIGPALTVYGGANTYSGGTTITSGTLQCSAANVMPPTGAVAMSGGVFSLFGNNQAIGTLSGTSNVSLGSGVLTTTTTTTSTYSGVIFGTGGLTVTGGGALNLTNNNTYSGGTTITSGTLRIQVADALLPAGDVVVNTPGVLNLNGFSQSVRNLTGTGSVTLDTAPTVLTVAPNANQVFAGRISGLGSVVKNGGFIWTLSGANTFTGGTTVNAGTLQLSANNALSANGAVALTGGNLDISPSTLQTIGTLSGSGGISLGTARLTVNGASNATYSGVMALSAGSFVYQGPATLILSGVNLYTGGTTINGGTLQLGIANGLPAGGDLTINSPGVFNLNNFNQTIGALSGSGNTTLGTATLTISTPQTTTYSGVISGVGGALTFLGPGMLTLTGANSYTGGTVVSGGTLQGNTTSLQGTINNTATLIFNQTTDGTFSGTLIGAGALVKNGSANLTLLGAQTQGTTTVSAGGLLIGTGANLTSPVTVASGALLGGTGTITGNVTNNGTLQLGLGNLTITGNYNQAAGSTFSTSLTPTATGLLTVSAAVTIGSPAQVNIGLQPGVYNPTTFYTLITAAGGPVTGTFSAISFGNPFFGGSLVYNDPTGTVRLLLQMVPFSNVIQGGNAGKVAKCITPSQLPAGSDLLSIVQTLVFRPVSEVRDALDEIQPSQLTALKITEENNLVLARTAISQRVDDLYRTPCNPCMADTHPWSFWTNTSGDFLRQERQGVNRGFNARTVSGVFGFDRRLFSQLFLGLAGAYNHSSMKWNDSRGSGSISSYYVGPYMSWFNHRLFLSLSGLASFNDYHASRHIRFTNINRHSTSEHRGYSAIAHLDFGVILYPAVDMTFSPFLGVDYIYLHEKGYSEKGARSLSLNIASSHADLLRGELGLKIAKCATLKHSKWTHDLKLSWIHQHPFNGEHLTASFRSVSCQFTVTGMEPNRDFLNVATGLTGVFVKDLLSAALRYEGKFGDGISDNTGYLQLIFRF